MPDLIHTRDFASRFGLDAEPSRHVLKWWRDHHGFPQSVGVPRGYYPAAEVEAWFAARRHRVPVRLGALYFIEHRQVQELTCEVPDISMLRIVLGMHPLELPDMVTVLDEPHLVAIGRAASADAEGAFSICGHAMQGRCLIAARAKDAGELPRGAGPLHLERVPLELEEIAELIAWQPAAVAEKGGGPDVEMLDAYCQRLVSMLGTLQHGYVLRLHLVDEAGASAGAVNVMPEWRALRRAVLDAYDRRQSVSHDWAVRAQGEGETALRWEAAEVKAKPGGHQLEVSTIDGKPAFVSVHAQPIAAAKLGKREPRRVCFPGVPCFTSDGSTFTPTWKLAE